MKEEEDEARKEQERKGVRKDDKRKEGEVLLHLSFFLCVLRKLRGRSPPPPTGWLRINIWSSSSAKIQFMRGWRENLLIFARGGSNTVTVLRFQVSHTVFMS